MSDRPILQVTDNAREKVLRVRSQEPEPDALALWIEVSGIQEGQYAHQLRVAPVADAGDDHLVEDHGGLPVVIRRDQADALQGATITIEGDPLYGAIAVSNPNRPTSPVMGGDGASLSGPIEQRVAQVLDAIVNPSIAAHGGRAELVRVEGETAYLRLGGGCQGCGLAKVTLSQGIEVAIRDNVPEITNVVDVTDHESGSSPYFESSKK